MHYLLQLNNNMNFNLTSDTLNMDEVTAKLNDKTTTFINFGGMVVNKHIVIGVFPIDGTQAEDK
ncbi:hypothetical protein ACE1MS_11695 [Lysinibacillus sp. fkY74-1]